MTTALARIEHVVLAVGDVHAIGVGPREPSFAHGGDGAAVALEGVFVVEETALRLQVVGPRHVHGELAAQQREQVLADLGEHAPFAFDEVGRTPCEQLLPDEGELVALHVLERQLVAPAEGASIHEEHVLAVRVADLEVVAPAPEFLLQHVAHTGEKRIQRRR